jgi:hypothetical protein
MTRFASISKMNPSPNERRETNTQVLHQIEWTVAFLKLLLMKCAQHQEIFHGLNVHPPRLSFAARCSKRAVPVMLVGRNPNRD